MRAERVLCGGGGGGGRDDMQVHNSNSRNTYCQFVIHCIPRFYFQGGLAYTVSPELSAMMSDDSFITVHLFLIHISMKEVVDN